MPPRSPRNASSCWRPWAHRSGPGRQKLGRWTAWDHPAQVIGRASGARRDGQGLASRPSRLTKASRRHRSGGCARIQGIRPIGLQRRWTQFRLTRSIVALVQCTPRQPKRAERRPRPGLAGDRQRPRFGTSRPGLAVTDERVSFRSQAGLSRWSSSGSRPASHGSWPARGWVGRRRAEPVAQRFARRQADPIHRSMPEAVARPRQQPATTGRSPRRPKPGRNEPLNDRFPAPNLRAVALFLRLDLATTGQSRRASSRDHGEQLAPLHLLSAVSPCQRQGRLSKPVPSLIGLLASGRSTGWRRDWLPLRLPWSGIAE